MSANFDLAPSDWATLRRLLGEALECPAAQRATWLEALDPQFEAFKPRLRALLDHAAQGTEALLDTLPKVETLQFAERVPGSADDGFGPDDHVGPYRLKHRLGEGGMGEVWLAERTDMLQGRPVALKLPRLVTGRAALAQRLAREREILATLAHPNIARLYDAGLTDDGQPYIALEYVEGERIDAYCLRKALSVPARLHLFLQVARAVAHAHARLVVHRDLKPANILVTEAGEVKLLDFGIAKLLADGPAQETQLTQLAGRALTPDYAAPEQILGQPIGTAADVYALGVVLFELLTGQQPYRLKRDSRAALEEAIVQAEVRRPSEVATEPKLKKRLRGDLDTIVLKALKRAPEERYGTVVELAEDLERHVSKRPVRARPDSAAYRARRFIARNALVVGAAACVLLAVIAGATAALWQADKAMQQQQRANAEMQLARKAERIANAQTTLADFLANDLITHRTTSEVESQIERAAGLVRKNYAEDALLRAHLLATLAGRYRRMSNFAAWRVLAAEAETAAREAGDVELVAKIACNRARDAAQSGRVIEAGNEVQAQIEALDRQDPRPNAVLTSCLADASAIARMTGNAKVAVATAERIRDIELQAGMARSINHAGSLMILSRAYSLAGRYAEAASTALQGVELHVAAGSGQTPGAHNVRHMHATAVRDGGQPRQAVELMDRAQEQPSGRASGDAPATLAYEHALALIGSGRSADAIFALERALASSRQRGDRSTARAAATALALALAQQGRADEASAALEGATRAYAEASLEHAYVSRNLWLTRAQVALAQGDISAASRALDSAEEVVRTAGQASDPTWRPLLMLRARASMAANNRIEAAEQAGAALRLARAQAVDPNASVHVGEALLLLAQLHQAAGNPADAQRDAAQALRHLQATAAPTHPDIAAANQLLR